MHEELRELELTALRVWPAVEEWRLGEWLIRLSEGYTKRANAVSILGREPGLDLGGRLSECAKLYRDRGLPLIVRESSLVANDALAELMIERGFSRIDETQVMVLDQLAGNSFLPDQAELNQWLELHVRFASGAKGNQRHHRAIIERIATPICLAIRHDAGKPVAIGLAVADGKWVGLFNIAADPARRRQGHGRALMEGLLAWGQNHQVERAYLSVSADNAPAVALYEGLGFREAYRYWYWMEPKS